MLTDLFSNYDFIMSQMLTSGESGRFQLEHQVIKAGTILDCYDRTGRIVKRKSEFDFPVVILAEDGKTWMSDSPLEVESAMGAVRVARGDCLIGGLGIGLIPSLIRNMVDSIDIVELNQDVIDLVYLQIATAKTFLINDDIYHYLDTTDKKYDFIYIDIWGSFAASMREIEKAREKAKRCLKPDGVIWCWLQELYDRIKDRLPKEPVSPKPLGLYAPCLVCGKEYRSDYAGLCTGCADDMRVSEFFLTDELSV